MDFVRYWGYDFSTVYKAFSQRTKELPIGRIIQRGTVTGLSDEILPAYEAPFPTEAYKAGARAFPALVPTMPDDPAAEPNRKAWETLSRFAKPFLTAFGDSDPILGRYDRVLQRRIPGAKGQAHTTLRDAGHFSQEDQGEELARLTLAFMNATSR